MKIDKWIEISGARQHNLKNIDLRLPKAQLSVVTGPSGSGKSSLAFSTLYAEGQRRFMESLNTYARQFLEKQEKPDVDKILGLAPTIAIEQKNHTKNSRSTVGTATEVYDYLRLLFAKVGRMYCPRTGEEVKKNVASEVFAELLSRHPEQRCYVGFPFEFSPKSKVSDRKLSLNSLMERGFTRAIPYPLKKSKLALFDLQDELSKRSSSLWGKAGSASQLFILADRFSLDEESRGRFEDSLTQAYAEGLGRAQAIVFDENEKILSDAFYTDYPSIASGQKRFPEATPLLFSFNSPLDERKKCRGFGNILRVDPKLVIPHETLSIAQGAIDPYSKPSGREWLKELVTFCRDKKIPINIPWKMLSKKQQDLIWFGDEKKYFGIEGVFKNLEEDRYKKTVRIFLSRYRSPQTCTSCSGYRLKSEALGVKIHNKHIGEIAQLSIRDLQQWIEQTPWTPTEIATAEEIFNQIKSRLDFLLRVGLDYLNLNRLAKTLSGGEAQRIALANQLGTRLTQTCYVLDEPSIGLHPKDTERLISILKDLTALKNTVVVVEHDPDIIQNADYLVDLGPKAGTEGGHLIYQGDYKSFCKKLVPESATWSFINGTEHIPVPARRRTDRFKDRKQRVQWLQIKGCQENNLKNVDFKIPRAMFSCITGVSGSGKSSAIRKTLYPALARILMAQVEEVGKFETISGFEGLENVLLIDQQPIGRSSRSNPITFMKGFDQVREIMASTLEARRAGYHAGYFSFNVPGGRCEACEGEGMIRVEMLFMEDMFLKCDICDGKRYKKETLAIQHQGKNIDDILNMTVQEAKKFFNSEKRLFRIFDTLESVGLGYLRLGQTSNSLSGGESQRLKIARELMRNDSSACVYILDEPTTGLHFRDIDILLKTLDQLVERGNTVIVIEHNLDVMKHADWIVDFGPEGGDRGGEVVFEGVPEQMVKRPKGHTAQYLSKSFKALQKASKALSKK